MQLLNQLGAAFVHDRSDSKHRAYKNLQLGLMGNLGTLTEAWAAKDLISTSMDIEKFLKDNPDATGENETPLELFTKWLSEPVAPPPSGPDQGDEEETDGILVTQ